MLDNGSMDEDTATTHKAYALRSRRAGKTVWRKWKDIGDASFKVPTLPDNLKHLAPYLPELLKILRCHVDLDATPIGGFDGHVRILPADVSPDAASSEQSNGQPERPGTPTDQEEDFTS